MILLLFWIMIMLGQDKGVNARGGAHLAAVWMFFLFEHFLISFFSFSVILGLFSNDAKQHNLSNSSHTIATKCLALFLFSFLFEKKGKNKSLSLDLSFFLVLFSEHCSFMKTWPLSGSCFPSRPTAPRCTCPACWTRPPHGETSRRQTL